MSSKKNILVLFDVDGTLTKSRQQISHHLQKFLLEKLKPIVSIGLVSGSDYPKIAEQLSGAHVLPKFDYVFCENGVAQYRNGQLVSQESILNLMGEKKLQKLINFCLQYLSTIELPAKRGNFIEFRKSMINVSPVGRGCNQAERDEFEQYDKEHQVRVKFVQTLKKQFPNSNLVFALGGQISVDIFPVGWDKTYCLNLVEKDGFDEIHFFGDKVKEGGNDYEIYNDKRTIGHEVTSPQDTEEQLKNLFNIIDDK